MEKKFYRDIERVLQEIDVSSGAETVLEAILNRLVSSQNLYYGIKSGRIYREQAVDYVLIRSLGGLGRKIAGKTVAKSYPIVQEIEKKRLVVVSPDSPGFDPDLEAEFTDLDYAAILVGANPHYILSFGLERTHSEEELLVLLETIRAAAGLKLRQNALEDQLHQAQIIQMSLLPRELPHLAGFDIAAKMVPADEVGGDIYDVQEVTAGTLGIAIADASGHGLPAALQARDVVTGLRMGVARDHKIPPLMRRLNRVIHQSGLSSRFISLFYCEIEDNGNIFYVNCGHCPPVLINPHGTAFEFPSSGPVLGPLPNAIYRRNYATLRPGEYLVLFTDGVTERELAVKDTPDTPTPGSDSGLAADEIAEFGATNLIRICRENLGSSAEKMVTAIMTAVADFGDGGPFADDATVMVIRRLPAEEFEPKGNQGAVRTHSALDVADRR